MVPPPALSPSLGIDDRTATSAGRPTRPQLRSTLLLGMALAVAIGWSALLRWPMVVNAPKHLDSDLAVDGLTLLDATQGRWRWHYPGTPFIGTVPVLFSIVPAWLVGVGPSTLVSGGVLAFALLIALTFALNLRAFGPGVALWGLVPLTFASTGMIWLSARITDGHLAAAAWHAGAFAIWVGGWKHGGVARSIALGLWLGLGLYVDALTAATWFGLAVAASVGLWEGRKVEQRRGRKRLAPALAFVVAVGLGVSPRFVAVWADPYDSYREQFQPDTDYDEVMERLWIMLLDCQPRLVAGHLLPGLETMPRRWPDGTRPDLPTAPGKVEAAATLLSLALFVRCLAGLLISPGRRPGRSSSPPAVEPGEVLPRRAVAWGLLASSTLIACGFLVNRTIQNSDNYRYLVFLLVAWSTGFGVAFDRAWDGGVVRKAWTAGLAVAFAAFMTLDASRWYVHLGWVRPDGVIPSINPVDDPALRWIGDHPEVDGIVGDYWDVYRISFLLGGRVAGVPLSIYPNRFPEVSGRFPGGHPRFLLVRSRRKRGLPDAREAALREGGREVGAGDGFAVIDWPPRPAPGFGGR